MIILFDYDRMQICLLILIYRAFKDYINLQQYLLCLISTKNSKEQCILWQKMIEDAMTRGFLCLFWLFMINLIIIRIYLIKQKLVDGVGQINIYLGEKASINAQFPMPGEKSSKDKWYEQSRHQISKRIASWGSVATKGVGFRIDCKWPMWSGRQIFITHCSR